MASEPTVEDVIEELESPSMTQVRIGEVEGRWTFLLKCTLVVIPFLTSLGTWAVWVTGNVYTSRQTTELVEKLSREIREQDVKFGTLPPEEWKERIRALERDGKQNLADHASILISLEQIKSAVGVRIPSGGRD